MVYAYPRVTISFCTACKWNLRAAWYLQELLSTFGNDLGEVALVPSSAGTFIVDIQKSPAQDVQQTPKSGSDTQHVSDSDVIVLWDRKVNGGFPDSKELKQLVRDVIKPGKDLGHVDRHAKQAPKQVTSPHKDNDEIQEKIDSARKIAEMKETELEQLAASKVSLIQGDACPNIN